MRTCSQAWSCKLFLLEFDEFSIQTSQRKQCFWVLHSSALSVLLIICFYNLFQESQRQTKIVLDQKWVVLFEYEVHFVIRPKLSLNAPFFHFFGKIKLFWKKAHLKSRCLLGIWCDCVINFIIVKYGMSAFTSTKNQIDWRKTHCFSSIWNS